MGKVKASCGHWLTEEEGLGIAADFADLVFDHSYPDGGMMEAIYSGNFCKKCIGQRWLKKAIKRAKELKKEWNLK